jgi:hypothetical protein
MSASLHQRIGVPSNLKVVLGRSDSLFDVAVAFDVTVASERSDVIVDGGWVWEERMAGPSMADDRWSVVVSALVAAAMSAIAVVTVTHAGCSEPGRYVQHGGQYELVGGCLEPGDLPVAPDTQPLPPHQTTDRGAPLRP